MPVKSLLMESVDDESEVLETIGADERVFGEEIDRAENFVMVGTVVTLVLSLIISLAVFFGIVVRKSEMKLKLTRWLKEFLNFRKLWVVGILKYVYLFMATFVTIGGIVVMFYGGPEPWVMVLVGIGVILVGNLALRLSFEMTMVVLGLWENTRDIRGVLVDGKKITTKTEKKEEKSDKVKNSEE